MNGVRGQMELNNIYNFKNPVKHFLNIDGLIFPNNISSFDIGSLDWAEPVDFRIHKVQLINVNSKMRKNLFYFLTKKGRTFPLVKISFFERY